MEGRRGKEVKSSQSTLRALVALFHWLYVACHMRAGLGAQVRAGGGITYRCLHEGEQPGEAQAAGAPGPLPPPWQPAGGAGVQSPRDSGMQGAQGRSGTNLHPLPPQTQH